MTNKLKQRKNYSTLVIHSTDNSFGFGYRKNNKLNSDKFFIKKFDNEYLFAKKINKIKIPKSEGLKNK